MRYLYLPYDLYLIVSIFHHAPCPQASDFRHFLCPAASAAAILASFKADCNSWMQIWEKTTLYTLAKIRTDILCDKDLVQGSKNKNKQLFTVSEFKLLYLIAIKLYELA